MQKALRLGRRQDAIRGWVDEVEDSIRESEGELPAPPSKKPAEKGADSAEDVADDGATGAGEASKTESKKSEKPSEQSEKKDEKSEQEAHQKEEKKPEPHPKWLPISRVNPHQFIRRLHRFQMKSHIPPGSESESPWRFELVSAGKDLLSSLQRMEEIYSWEPEKGLTDTFLYQFIPIFEKIHERLIYLAQAGLGEFEALFCRRRAVVPTRKGARRLAQEISESVFAELSDSLDIIEELSSKISRELEGESGGGSEEKETIINGRATRYLAAANIPSSMEETHTMTIERLRKEYPFLTQEVPEGLTEVQDVRGAKERGKGLGLGLSVLGKWRQQIVDSIRDKKKAFENTIVNSLLIVRENLRDEARHDLWLESQEEQIQNFTESTAYDPFEHAFSQESISARKSGDYPAYPKWLTRDNLRFCPHSNQLFRATWRVFAEVWASILTDARHIASKMRENEASFSKKFSEGSFPREDGREHPRTGVRAGTDGTVPHHLNSWLKVLNHLNRFFRRRGEDEDHHPSRERMGGCLGLGEDGTCKMGHNNLFPSLFCEEAGSGSGKEGEEDACKDSAGVPLVGKITKEVAAKAAEIVLRDPEKHLPPIRELLERVIPELATHQGTTEALRRVSESVDGEEGQGGENETGLFNATGTGIGNTQHLYSTFRAVRDYLKIRGALIAARTRRHHGNSMMNLVARISDSLLMSNCVDKFHARKLAVPADDPGFLGGFQHRNRNSGIQVHEKISTDGAGEHQWDSAFRVGATSASDFLNKALSVVEYQDFSDQSQAAVTGKLDFSDKLQRIESGVSQAPTGAYWIIPGRVPEMSLKGGSKSESENRGVGGSRAVDIHYDNVLDNDKYTQVTLELMQGLEKSRTEKEVVKLLSVGAGGMGLGEGRDERLLEKFEYLDDHWQVNLTALAGFRGVNLDGIAASTAEQLQQREQLRSDALKDSGIIYTRGFYETYRDLFHRELLRYKAELFHVQVSLHISQYVKKSLDTHYNLGESSLSFQAVHPGFRHDRFSSQYLRDSYIPHLEKILSDVLLRNFAVRDERISRNSPYFNGFFPGNSRDDSEVQSRMISWGRKFNPFTHFDLKDSEFKALPSWTEGKIHGRIPVHNPKPGSAPPRTDVEGAADHPYSDVTSGQSPALLADKRGLVVAGGGREEGQGFTRVRHVNPEVYMNERDEKSVTPVRLPDYEIPYWSYEHDWERKFPKLTIHTPKKGSSQALEEESRTGADDPLLWYRGAQERKTSDPTAREYSSQTDYEDYHHNDKGRMGSALPRGSVDGFHPPSGGPLRAHLLDYSGRKLVEFPKWNQVYARLEVNGTTIIPPSHISDPELMNEIYREEKDALQWQKEEEERAKKEAAELKEGPGQEGEGSEETALLSVDSGGDDSEEATKLRAQEKVKREWERNKCRAVVVTAAGGEALASASDLSKCDAIVSGKKISATAVEKTLVYDTADSLWNPGELPVSPGWPQRHPSTSAVFASSAFSSGGSGGSPPVSARRRALGAKNKGSLTCHESERDHTSYLTNLEFRMHCTYPLLRVPGCLVEANRLGHLEGLVRSVTFTSSVIHASLNNMLGEGGYLAEEVTKGKGSGAGAAAAGAAGGIGGALGAAAGAVGLRWAGVLQATTGKASPETHSGPAEDANADYYELRPRIFEIGTGEDGQGERKPANWVGFALKKYLFPISYYDNINVERGVVTSEDYRRTKKVPAGSGHSSDSRPSFSQYLREFAHLRGSKRLIKFKFHQSDCLSHYDWIVHLLRKLVVKQKKEEPGVRRQLQTISIGVFMGSVEQRLLKEPLLRGRLFMYLIDPWLRSNLLTQIQDLRSEKEVFSLGLWTKKGDKKDKKKGTGKGEEAFAAAEAPEAAEEVDDSNQNSGNPTRPFNACPSNTPCAQLIVDRLHTTAFAPQRTALDRTERETLENKLGGWTDAKTGVVASPVKGLTTEKSRILESDGHFFFQACNRLVKWGHLSHEHPEDNKPEVAPYILTTEHVSNSGEKGKGKGGSPSAAAQTGAPAPMHGEISRLTRRKENLRLLVNSSYTGPVQSSVLDQDVKTPEGVHLPGGDSGIFDYCSYTYARAGGLLKQYIETGGEFSDVSTEDFCFIGSNQKQYHLTPHGSKERPGSCFVTQDDEYFDRESGRSLDSGPNLEQVEESQSAKAAAARKPKRSQKDEPSDLVAARIHQAKIRLSQVPLQLKIWHRQQKILWGRRGAPTIQNSAHPGAAPASFQVLQDFSQNTMGFFKDDSVDFLFVDGDHSESGVRQDIELFFWKVRKSGKDGKGGGILAGHDFGLHSFPGMIHGVLQVLNEIIIGVCAAKGYYGLSDTGGSGNGNGGAGGVDVGGGLPFPDRYCEDGLTVNVASDYVYWIEF